MVTRIQLAVMDFNAGSDFEPTKTMEKKERFTSSFSKVTQIQSTKSIKEKKGDAHVFCMMDGTMEVMNEKVELKNFQIYQKHCPKTLPKTTLKIRNY